jgi:hypothetical protein
LVQIRLWGFDREMEVMAHDHKRVPPPAKRRAGFKQTPLEGEGRPRVCEQVAPVIAAIDHVVTGPGKFHSYFARHAPQRTRLCAVDNPWLYPNHGLPRNNWLQGGFTIHDMTPSSPPNNDAADLDSAGPDCRLFR